MTPMTPQALIPCQVSILIGHLISNNFTLFDLCLLLKVIFSYLPTTLVPFSLYPSFPRYSFSYDSKLSFSHSHSTYTLFKLIFLFTLLVLLSKGSSSTHTTLLSLALLLFLSHHSSPFPLLLFFIHCPSSFDTTPNLVSSFTTITIFTMLLLTYHTPTLFLLLPLFTTFLLSYIVPPSSYYSHPSYTTPHFLLL